jgi:hypothetical protein
MGTIFRADAAAFTRPANTTAYAQNDLVADNVTAGSVTPIIFPRSKLRGRTSGKITGASLEKSAASLTTADFLLYLFNQAKTLTNGDNGAIVFNSWAGYIGAIALNFTTTPVGLPPAGTAGTPARCRHQGTVDLKFNASQNIYGYLAANSAYTPASAETFLATIDIEA